MFDPKHTSEVSLRTADLENLFKENQSKEKVVVQLPRFKLERPPDYSYRREDYPERSRSAAL